MEDEATFEEVAAAIRIQKVFRGYILRYHSSKFDKETASACIIQKAWRQYKERMTVQKCKEILALIKITRVIKHYKRRIRSRDEFGRLQRFDHLLSYFPAKSRAPPPKKRRVRRKRGARKKKITAPPPIIMSATYARPKRTGPPRKRKILVELPPPWHNKDPKRISQSQKDEMLYNQKEDIQWAKRILMRSLLRRCGNRFDMRDELSEKNRQFNQRTVLKPFLGFTHRTIKHIHLKAIRGITAVASIPTYYVYSNSRIVGIDVTSRTDDRATYDKTIIYNKPLYDVAVHQTSGQLFGISTNWELVLIENGKVTSSLQLSSPAKIPKVNKYVQIDKFGFVWVCLFPQRGKMYCIDPITMTPTIIYSLDAASISFPQLRKSWMFTPLSNKDNAVGFAFTFTDTKEVHLFTTDFLNCKKLRHPNMKHTPIIKQVGKHLMVWSADSIIYIYANLESFARVELVGTIKIRGCIVDIVGTTEPDLIFVALMDGTVRAYIGKSHDVPLKYPEFKMTNQEKEFAGRLLSGPETTSSRKIFTEVGRTKFSNEIVKISTMSFNEKLILIVAAFMNGSTASAWASFASFPVSACDFDSFELKQNDMKKLHSMALSEYDSIMPKKMEKKNQYNNTHQRLENFEITASVGQIRKLFNQTGDSFSLVNYILDSSLRALYSFMPPVPEKTISAYEAFVFLKKSDVLPSAISDFAEFLERFAPPEMKRKVPEVERPVNNKLPVKTEGVYNAIANIPFTSQMLEKIIEMSNSLNQLYGNLSNFTIESVKAKHTNPEVKKSTQRNWVLAYERESLLARLHVLERLEATVQCEMMNRVQMKLNANFRENLIQRQLNAPALEIPESVPFDEPMGDFDSRPNRNPLLYEHIHRSVYESWAAQELFRMDSKMRMAMKLELLPRMFFDSQVVMNHFKFVQRLSRSGNMRVASAIYGLGGSGAQENAQTRILISEDTGALPLSHFLTTHSFMGGDSRLIASMKCVMTKVLMLLQQLHKNNIILRTLCPDNIMLNQDMGTVSFQSVYDAQLLAGAARSTYLPLPEKFASPSNPFLPPEYFHSPPRKFTTAFDVWQFGILLLYVITGQLPVSYGSELMKNLNRSPNKVNRVVISEASPLDDPPVYPKTPFFYDWMATFRVVGENEKCTGDHGECLIQTPTKIASILNLDTCRLLPYKNAKNKVDEAKVLIEIIACCLQTDPEKRPTVNELLRTITFNQLSLSGEALDAYMRVPDPQIFISQFFAPVLSSLSDKSFPFAVGIISALIFKDQANDDDREFAFPLDSRASEEVMKALFNLHFMDTLVFYTIKHTTAAIQVSNVNPVVKFVDPHFEAMYHFFDRFVNAADHGHGILMNYIDEVATSLLALYTGNPFLRHTSDTIVFDRLNVGQMDSIDSAAYFVFTYHRMSRIIHRVVEGSLNRSIKRTPEHNDNYFNNFLGFADKVNDLCRAICFSIEKQKQNAARSITTGYGTGQNTSAVRLYVDFNVPQKITMMLPLKCAAMEALQFINSALRSVKLKSTDPTYMLLKSEVQSPCLFQYISGCLKRTDVLKQLSVDTVRQVVFGDSSYAISQLVIADTFWTVADCAADIVLRSLINDILSYSSVFVMEIIMSSNSLQQSLTRAGIEFVPRVSAKDLKGPLTLDNALVLAKRLSSALFIRQSSLPLEFSNEPPPVNEAADFLLRGLKLALLESSRIAEELDKVVTHDTRFDLKGTTFLKAKAMAKETNFNDTKNQIEQLSQVLLHLFRCLCFYWCPPQKHEYSKELLDFILQVVVEDIPVCKSMSHPAASIHQCLQQMCLYCLANTPAGCGPHQHMRVMNESLKRIMERDLSFLMVCVDNDVVEVQITKRYFVERRVRMRLFEAVFTDSGIQGSFHLLRFVIDEMLHNATCFGEDAPLSLRKHAMYPIRSEAVDMLLFLIERRETMETTVKRIADEMAVTNFLEREAKLTEEYPDTQLVSTSIMLLRAITTCQGIFEEKYIQRCANLLESLCMRYSREWKDIDMGDTRLSIRPQVLALPPQGGTSSRAMTSRPMTTLALRASTSRPGSSVQRSSITSARTARPTTQLRSTTQLKRATSFRK